MSDEDVAEAAARNGTTRASASMDKAAELCRASGEDPGVGPGLLFAVGNLFFGVFKLLFAVLYLIFGLFQLLFRLFSAVPIRRTTSPKGCPSI